MEPIIIVQFLTFNPVEINGVKTFDNLFIVLDNEDKLGAGMIYPKTEEKVNV